MPSEPDKYVSEKVLSGLALNMFRESKAFFDEFASATRKSPVRINGEVVGFIYRTGEGELKGVSIGEISAYVKRFGTSILITKQIAKKL